MTFGGKDTRRSPQDRSLVPMINVVFLLLIFFLMTANLTPPPPLDITAPEADSAQTTIPEGTLFIGATGEMVFNQSRDEAVFAVIAARRDETLPVLVDAGFSAAALAGILSRLAALGIRDIDLLTVLP